MPGHPRPTPSPLLPHAFLSEILPSLISAGSQHSGHFQGLSMNRRSGEAPKPTLPGAVAALISCCRGQRSVKATPNSISHLCRHDQSPSIHKCPCNGELGMGTAARLWPSSPLIRITVDYGASCFGEEVQEPSWKAEGSNTSEQPQRPRISSRPIVLDSPRLPKHTGRTSNATQVLPKVPGTI